MSSYGVGERGDWIASADMRDMGSKPGDMILQSIGGVQRISMAGMEVSVRGPDFVALKVGAGARFGGKRVAFVCIKQTFGGAGYEVHITDRAGKNVRKAANLQAGELRDYLAESTGLKLSAQIG